MNLEQSHQILSELCARSTTQFNGLNEASMVHQALQCIADRARADSEAEKKKALRRSKVDAPPGSSK